ncbi:S8 family serine peptidase [Cerasicoccus frondis]|uniref:S8 family serine peptidase n=1 Tax=Cerasicoccus frondis TaxID=490090 RepID=UPI002852D88D|nr:S8 family serine peptidase [Cerasicoccus frondis]
MRRSLPIVSGYIVAVCFALWLALSQSSVAPTTEATRASVTPDTRGEAKPPHSSETAKAGETIAAEIASSSSDGQPARRNPILAEILDRSELLDARTVVNTDGSRIEKRLYRTPEKYPHWRVETHWDEYGEYQRDIVEVADHLIARAPLESIEATKLKLERAGLTIRKQLFAPGHLLVSGPEPSLDALEVIQNRLAQSDAASDIEHAETDPIVFAIATTPNDTRYSEQWMHDTSAEDGPHIGSPAAWDVQTSAADIVVGVIDTGIDHSHVDLAANIWVNPGEIDGNGIDDDGNGLIDDYHGYDFYNDDGDPMDDNNHGTHCAGIIGAVGDNGIGVAGVAWETQLMGLKFLSASGAGSLSDALNCIYYAWFMDADLTSNSWGASGETHFLFSDAIRLSNIPFVAAAGNESEDTDANPHMPSSDDEENIIAVASHNRYDSFSYFSNYGATSVDLSAPGQSILSTVRNNGYRSMSGTSMATPCVAGAVALLLQHEPDLSPAEVKAQLLATATPVDYLASKTVSGARLNLANLLGAGVVNIPEFTSSDSARGFIGEAFFFSVTADNEPTSFDASGLPDGLSIHAVTGAITGYPSASGDYTVTLTAANDAGAAEQTWLLDIGNELDLWVYENISETGSGDDIENQDADEDGVSDLINYATGTYSSTQSRENLPSVGSDNGLRTLLYTYRRLEGSGAGSSVAGYTIAGITYTVWLSDDMTNWETGESVLEEIEALSNGDGTESITLASRVDAPLCFFKLEVTPAQ